MPKGELPKADVTFPEKISESKDVMQFARTAAESGHLSDEMSEEEKRSILNGALTYKVISDESQ